MSADQPLPDWAAAEISKILVSGAALALGTIGFSHQLLAEPRGMSALDMVEMSRISKPALSPDGLQVIYLRSEVDWLENEDVKRLWLQPEDLPEVSQILEPAEPAESFKQAAWMPDGIRILTVLNRDEDSHDQAYVYHLGENKLTRLTNHSSDVGDIAVAPDAEGFYFRAEQQITETAASEEVWNIEEFETKPRNELSYFDLATGKSRALLAGAFDVRSYTVAQDGSKILYVRAATALKDEQDRELWLYDIRTEETRRVTNNGFAEQKPALSPDNRRVAYIATVNEDGEPYYEDNIFVHEVGGRDSQLILPKTAMEMLDVEWDATGSGLYILGNTGLRTHLYHYDLRTKTLVDLTPGDHVISDWSYDAKIDTHLFLKVSAANPGEVWTLTTDPSSERQRTFEYADIGTHFRLPQQSAVSWPGRGGVTIEGLLVYPVDHEPGTRVPLVTVSHGGPRSSAQYGSWNMSRYVPVLAARGYAVFLPNYRGSNGYGDEFMRDMVGNYFTHAHHDVLDGIDALVKAGVADEKQLIKMGWSAGGHMTNKLITVTDRFRAASSGAGVADWVSLYGESDLRHGRTPWFGDAPWSESAPLQNYLSQSLLKDAWRITTPTLFFVGEDDVRVPPTQAIMMYRAAKAAGVETELYVAPGEEHQYKKPTHRLFKMNRELEWFARHLGQPDYIPVRPVVTPNPSE